MSGEIVPGALLSPRLSFTPQPLAISAEWNFLARSMVTSLLMKSINSPYLI